MLQSSCSLIQPWTTRENINLYQVNKDRLFNSQKENTKHAQDIDKHKLNGKLNIAEKQCTEHLENYYKQSRHVRNHFQLTLEALFRSATKMSQKAFERSCVRA